MGKNFVIACGGTGGHLFPGLAVAEVLHARGHEVVLLVSEKEIDALALSDRSEFRIEKLPSVGMPSLFSLAFFRFLRRTWESVSQCRRLCRRYRPVAVLGMGGFTSAAPILAAYLQGIPSFIHESNAIGGRANKLTARCVSKVLLGFEVCEASFPKTETCVTGTPVRHDLGKLLPREEALACFKLLPKKKTLLVMGGSQGAGKINQLLFRSATLLKELPVQIIHLTGEHDADLAAVNYQREGVPAHVASFHHSMNEVYSAADLIISRAGAASLSEISHFAIPSILIPYPFAAERHQHINASIFKEAGAAEVLEESEITPEGLVQLINKLLEDKSLRKSMSQKAHLLLPENAAETVADIMENEERF